MHIMVKVLQEIIQMYEEGVPEREIRFYLENVYSIEPKLRNGYIAWMKDFAGPQNQMTPIQDKSASFE